jgi:hypothetical protein
MTMKRWAWILALAAGCEPGSPATPKSAPTEPEAKAPEPAPPAEPKLPPSYTGKVIPFTAPKDWIQEEPDNRLRVVQYKLPDKEKKGADAQFVLSTSRIWNEEMRQENIQRWGRQMGVDAPMAETVQGKHKVTLVDLKGTYKADFEPEPIEGARLIVAALEVDGTPWFFKLVGPESTVTAWREAFLEMVKSAGP